MTEPRRSYSRPWPPTRRLGLWRRKWDYLGNLRAWWAAQRGDGLVPPSVTLSVVARISDTGVVVYHDVADLNPAAMGAPATHQFQLDHLAETPGFIIDLRVSE